MVSVYIRVYGEGVYDVYHLRVYKYTLFIHVYGEGGNDLSAVYETGCSKLIHTPALRVMSIS